MHSQYFSAVGRVHKYAYGVVAGSEMENKVMGAFGGSITVFGLPRA